MRDGFYSFGGLGRVPEIFLKATSGALNQTQGWYVQFGEVPNLLDFRL